MKANINIVTLNLSKGNLITEFQINNKSPELVVSKGITEQLEGNLKNLAFIINYAKKQGYDDIEIHAVIPTVKEELNGVVLPNFQEQTKKYIDGEYKENSSSAKELIKTVKMVRENHSIDFTVDLSKEDGMKLVNSLKEIKAKSPDDYKNHCHIAEKKEKEVKTVAFENSYIPQPQRRINTAPNFERIKAMQKREQERAERWKGEPFAVEIYNDKDEKEPIMLMGAKELNDIGTASYLADWWEQVEKKNVVRVGDDLKRLKGINNFSDRKTSMTENDYKHFVSECKKQYNIVDILDVDADLFLNKTINLSELSNEQCTALTEKLNKAYDIVFSVDDTNDFLVKVVKSNEMSFADWEMSDKIYEIKDIVQLQKERNLLSANNDKTETLGAITEKTPAPNIPVTPVTQPKKKSGFSINKFRNRNLSDMSRQQRQQQSNEQTYDEKADTNTFQLLV